jgi:hypothetical protein
MISTKLFKTAELRMATKFFENDFLNFKPIIGGKLATGKPFSSS